MKPQPVRVTYQEIHSAFVADLPKHLLPPFIASRYVPKCQEFLSSLNRESRDRMRSELFSKVNTVISNALTGKFEPPLDAYLKEIPYELLCFYIERILSVEANLKKAASLSQDTVAKPESWSAYWLQLLTKR